MQEVDSFIKEVKQIAKQMGYGDDAVLDCLKCCMPDHVSIALYYIDDLAQAIEMIQDIFSKVPKPAKQPDLFSSMQTSTASAS